MRKSCHVRTSMLTKVLSFTAWGKKKLLELQTNKQKVKSFLELYHRKGKDKSFSFVLS